MKANMWNLPPPPGFQGFREDLPLTVYHRDLPHWRQSGATYFVTFRLHDSLPQSKLRQLRAIKSEWERRNPPPRTKAIWDELSRETLRRVERWLDQGMGSCCVRQSGVARLLADELHREDNERYELGCYVIMPNHVHAVVRPLEPDSLDLEDIVRSWKGPSACSINQRLQQSGTLWQRESFDRIIRDAEHLWRVIQYVGSNPRRAKLQTDQSRLWIRPSWVECGWKFAQES